MNEENKTSKFKFSKNTMIIVLLIVVGIIFVIHIFMFRNSSNIFGNRQSPYNSKSNIQEDYSSDYNIQENYNRAYGCH